MLSKYVRKNSQNISDDIIENTLSLEYCKKSTKIVTNIDKIQCIIHDKMHSVGGIV